MRPPEIESLAEFDARVPGQRSLRGWHLQSIDLTGRSDLLRSVDVAGAVFLGCRFADGDEVEVRRRGGLVFPTVPDVPFDAYRGALYTPDELYAGLEGGYPTTFDAVVYAWSRKPRSLDKRLAEALHDHSIDDALDERVRRCYDTDRPLVGVMGGHAVQRGDATYREAAELGRALAGSFTVVTGGGPGAMEAANLGAWLADCDQDAFDDALDLLAQSPDFTEDATGWAQAAFEVRRRWPDGCESLGVPTWFYGHEPPNAFASHHAKYFRNALREDELLRICRGGVVFLPGAAGTVQEVFQDACSNYYAAAGDTSPMVMVGREHWSGRLPAWQLLLALGEGRPFESGLHLVDSAAEVLPLLLEEGGRGR